MGHFFSRPTNEDLVIAANDIRSFMHTRGYLVMKAEMEAIIKQSTDQILARVPADMTACTEHNISFTQGATQVARLIQLIVEQGERIAHEQRKQNS